MGKSAFLVSLVSFIEPEQGWIFFAIGVCFFISLVFHENWARILCIFGDFGTHHYMIQHTAVCFLCDLLS